MSLQEFLVQSDSPNKAGWQIEEFFQPKFEVTIDWFTIGNDLDAETQRELGKEPIVELNPKNLDKYLEFIKKMEAAQIKTMLSYADRIVEKIGEGCCLVEALYNLRPSSILGYDFTVYGELLSGYYNTQVRFFDLEYQHSYLEDERREHLKKHVEKGGFYLVSVEVGD
jgi:hypothetical protein